MRNLARVVWAEGMHLGPHQFQLQTRYVEDSIRFAAQALWRFSFGVTGLQLDDEALRNGTVSLIHARGVMPDGTSFHMPECDAAPAARSIRDLFPPTADSVTVSLAIPKYRPEGSNLGTSLGTGPARYYAETRAVCDENTGGDERPVEFARKNVRFVFDVEPGDGQDLLPLARVRRDGAGQFVYDPDFIPPCLQISASSKLMRLVGELIEMLGEKTAALTRSSTTTFSSPEVANFWLRHAINSALPPLNHIWVSRHGHPEDLFVELSRLGGALCTFSLNSHPSALPKYEHERPSDCFALLDAHIRRHLQTVIPVNCITIPLKKTEQYTYTGEVTDTRCFARSEWILGIRASIGDLELISRAPGLVKVCSARFISELVRRAIDGVPLRHLPMPPPAVHATAEKQYFAISKEGKFWDNIVQTRGVGIYVPGDIPNAELDLSVVLDTANMR